VRLLAGIAAAYLTVAASPALARTLIAGAGQQYSLPSEAIAAAADGDTIQIMPGDYFDCSIVRANDLTIIGQGDAGMTDKVCEEKAILVLRGNNITVRDLALRRARAPDGNGAGIRLENQNLTVDHVRFENDQVGILSGGGGGRVTVTNSVFERGGVGGERPKYAIMIGQSDALSVSTCTFGDIKGGLIATAATRSEITGNTMGLGAGDAEEDPANAVLATDGTLTMEHNVITVAPLAPRTGSAIGVWDDATAVLRQNQLINKTGQNLAFVKDWTWGSPVLQDNQIGTGDTLVTSSGIWRHRASSQYYTRKEQARALASQAKRMIKQMLGRP
jgi:hypothetical protein